MKRRLFSTLLSLLVLSSTVFAQEQTAQADPSLGGPWPKITGAFIRLKSGGLVDLPRFKDIAISKYPNDQHPVQHVFQMKSAPRYETYKKRDYSSRFQHTTAVISPEGYARIPIIDGDDIAAIVTLGYQRIQSIDALVLIREHLNDANADQWFHQSSWGSPDGQKPNIGDWGAAIGENNWGFRGSSLRVEKNRDPNAHRSFAYYIEGNAWWDWKAGRKFDDVRTVPLRGFRIIIGGTQEQFLFRVKQHGSLD